MTPLRALWRTARPRFLVSLGSVTALASGAAVLGHDAIAPGSLSEFAPTAASAILAFLLLLGTAAFRLQTKGALLLAGLVGSAVTLLAWPGIPGGTIAVVGAVWGLLSPDPTATAPTGP